MIDVSLFSRLQKQQRSTEDFFSEIVAHLFSEIDGLLFDWLSYHNLLDVDDYIDFQVSTQTSYDEGRPDILIELFTEDSEDWIFIESKLDAEEGHNQLQRYAQILADQKHVRRKLLVFITRNYDPKEAQSILKNVPPKSVTFKQLRWHDFYQFLKTRREDSLIDDTCAFMEEKRMAQMNQFTPSDVLAMSNMPQVFSLMNETLFGEVSHHFEKTVGSVSTERRARHEIRRNRYFIHGYPHRSYWCGIGYWFVPEGYPMLGMRLEMIPKGIKYAPDILSVFKELSELQGWEGTRLNKPKNHPHVQYRRPLNEFLVGADHVASIKAYFLELLSDLTLIAFQHPQLPWSNNRPAVAGSDEEE